MQISLTLSNTRKCFKEKVKTETGFIPFFTNNFPGLFQDFFRTQIHFSRAPKSTIIEAINA